MSDRRDEGVEMVRALTRWQRLGLAMLFLVGVAAVGGGVFVWTGYYNISAKAQHWDLTTQVLETVRDQSIHARAEDIPVPPLDDPDMIALGEAHYRGGCASCHGLPGEERNPVANAMLPNPPDLAYARQRYDEGALYWLIDNGIKYTGMPSWPADNRGDEVWSVVAYLLWVHNTRDRDMTIAPAAPDGEPVDTYGFHVLGQCSRCHGDEDTPPISDLVPELAGLPRAYLERSLIEYRNGTRPSGFMQPAAFSLTDEQISDLAQYYAALPPRSTTDTSADPEQLARGAEIALNGVPGDDVPACTSCHGNGNPQFPPLAGQSRRYLATQLDVWKNGGRDLTEYGSIMAVIGTRLSESQIEDVSAFFASLDAPAEVDR